MSREVPPRFGEHALEGWSSWCRWMGNTGRAATNAEWYILAERFALLDATLERLYRDNNSLQASVDAWIDREAGTADALQDALRRGRVSAGGTDD